MKEFRSGQENIRGTALKVCLRVAFFTAFFFLCVKRYVFLGSTGLNGGMKNATKTQGMGQSFNTVLMENAEIGFRPILCVTIDSVQNLTQMLTQMHTQTLRVNKSLRTVYT